MWSTSAEDRATTGLFDFYDISCLGDMNCWKSLIAHESLHSSLKGDGKFWKVLKMWEAFDWHLSILLLYKRGPVTCWSIPHQSPREKNKCACGDTERNSCEN